MTTVMALIVAIPLLGAGLAVGVPRLPGIRTVEDSRPHDLWLDVVTIASLVSVSGLSVALLRAVIADGTFVLNVGGWSSRLGIVLVADLFAAMVLMVALLTILVVEIFSLGQKRSAWGVDARVASPVSLVLATGVSLAILTGDLFTLFVGFELILISSYVLLTHLGRRGQIRSGMTYVVINLFASTLFLIGLGLLLSIAGTLNLALLADRLSDADPAVRWGIGLWFTVVFGTKAAVFPLFSWLPDSYPTAPTTITAVFAGLLTKIGVYCLIRVHTLLGMDELGPVLLVVAGVTMLVGVAGALAQNDIKRILSFHIISQIGYMVLGLGLFSVAGVAGAILFLIHQIPVKTVLFLVGGLVESETGTSSLARLGALAGRRPLMGLLFALPALSLAGLPPTSGFVGKFALLEATLDHPVLLAVGAGGSLLTLLSMVKIWLGAFWGPEEPDSFARYSVSPAGRGVMYVATSAAVAGTLAVAVWAGPLWDLSLEAAEDLLDVEPYVAPVVEEG